MLVGLLKGLFHALPLVNHGYCLEEKGWSDCVQIRTLWAKMLVKKKLRPGPVPGGTRGSTRNEILRLSEQIFAQEGFAGTSLDMIAEAVGIRRPSVLHHFASKREIYDQIESDIHVALAEQVDTRIAEVSDIFERLMALLDCWLDFMIQRPTAARILLRNASDLLSRIDDPVEFSEPVIAQFEAIVLEGQASGVFRPVAPMLVMNIVGMGILANVCNAEQLGELRRYQIGDQAVSGEIRLMLRQAAKAILC